MRTKQTFIMTALLICASVFNLALSCGEKEGSPSTWQDDTELLCDNKTYTVGSKCRALFDQIVVCCLNETIAQETARKSICNMDVDDSKCVQGGPAAVAAACAQPECADNDTEATTLKTCAATCSEDADCRKNSADIGFICKNSRCRIGCREGSSCVPSRPECNLSSNQCECSSSSCRGNQVCLASGVCGCVDNESCSASPTTPQCEKETGTCHCTLASCEASQRCMPSGKCGCPDDAHCQKILPGFICDTVSGDCICDDDRDCRQSNQMDTCYRGVCGCSSPDICTAEEDYDKATSVCEPPSK